MNQQGRWEMFCRWLAGVLGNGCWGYTLWDSYDSCRWIAWSFWPANLVVAARSAEILSFDDTRKVARVRSFWVLGLHISHWEFPA